MALAVLLVQRGPLLRGRFVSWNKRLGVPPPYAGGPPTVISSTFRELPIKDQRGGPDCPNGGTTWRPLKTRVCLLVEDERCGFGAKPSQEQEITGSAISNPQLQGGLHVHVPRTREQ